MRAVEEALEFVDTHSEGTWEPELYRLKGELLLQRASEGRNRTSNKVIEESESCFLRAIECAQRNESKSFELRAAMSLDKLWTSQGNRKKAHDMLRKVYDWFTEGLDTPDLKDARHLLKKQ